MQLERQIQNSIMDYLMIAVKDFTFITYDSKGAYNATVKRFQRNNKYKKLGVSDLIGWHHGTQRIIFAEIKTPTGRQSSNQKIFEKEVLTSGGIYVIWRSIKEAQNTILKLREEWDQ